MKVQTINGRNYRLPERLNEFQRELYVHLVDWKWSHITTEPGFDHSRGREIPYDAILPERQREDLLLIHPSVRDDLRRHAEKNGFRLHKHFHHMASSQAACVNLFLPILHHIRANEILAQLRPDFASLATDHLDNGYCLEFWGGNFDNDRSATGPLGDKSAFSGTDSDLAIAYRNRAGELCLWLIEHKLAEAEFTPCGGYTSRGRKEHPACDCNRSFAEIHADKDICYHHHVRNRQYWTLTEQSSGLFGGPSRNGGCPFQGGMNQLWRNLLLAFALEQDDREPYRHASFSVVKHHRNRYLDTTLNDFAALVGGDPRFSLLTSQDILQAADSLEDCDLTSWTGWYRTLYKV